MGVTLFSPSRGQAALGRHVANALVLKGVVLASRVDLGFSPRSGVRQLLVSMLNNNCNDKDRPRTDRFDDRPWA